MALPSEHSQSSDNPHDLNATETSCQTASVETLQKQGKPPRPSQINWTKSRTDRLVNWLEKHPKHRYVLFSDSPVVAKEENWDTLKSTKYTKAALHRCIARHVFNNDSNTDLQISVDHYHKWFGESVQNHLTSKAYKSHMCDLGSTGSGLISDDPSDAQFSSPLVRAKFPWWDCLNAFWKSSPKYNAKPTTSAPGQNLAGQAMTVFFSMRGDDGAFEQGMNIHYQGGGWDMIE
ncbi:hypothetical protein SERLA73DRAFT_79262 [Serpula lacrymans var. lacrymans S7.3]|uniref:Uncharacterized protein n=2 Tax=Serpula lacrymans var. lacrymans TaxID=341189 RepID=F8QFV2_SERL3|nr:uncharacterized protein SERLADRAFT_444056 [Serpula lacrymans var. lacrymans S7.9]EGN92797.1 hypothetical protein SERLA73DRAFT_79262 [Serpula lacrymans var. lacrymans S7.3]EGO18470.1 hypothetical protein SERLADRAFT_444056 [Serpula lacrymans var. lacrymans S7.9]